MKLVKIKDSSFVRDMSSNAVLNVNKAELNEFNEKRKRILAQKQQTEQMNVRLSNLENDVGEIKNLLKELIQIRSSNGN